MPRAVDIEGTAAGVEAGGRDPPPSTPLRVVVTYAAVGGLWILFSDRLLDQLVAPGPLNVALQTAKGWVFVLAGAALLYLLMRRDARQRAAVAAQVRAVLDSIEDAILVVDPGAHVVDANRAALGMFEGLLRGEVEIPLLDLAKASQMRMADGSPVLPDAFLPARVEGETLHRAAVVLHRGEGREVQAEVTAAPILERPGGPLRFAVVVLRDVSELRRRDELQDEFLATAAHEFKTPLAVIKAYVQLLQRRSTGEAAALEVVSRQVDRLSRLVQQLLEVARLKQGGPELALAEYDLSAQVREVLGRMNRMGGGQRLQATATAPAAVRADRDRIDQVLVSLLDNALKFSPHGGEVVVSVDRAGTEAVVSVRDSGLGIPPERQRQLFRRYYRAHEGDPDDRGGFGLGLDLAREIVSRHGGRVWFESETGSGSTFFFSLPLAPEAPHVRA
ncbi:MAG TPA: HAMP domain-containing sensor histidine kinase [Anaeromyxobacteraceae bacterium]|nr:HAMP domain-containing sensor histidine kinase [Anaeromyxobacteraceae bacterium]